MRISGEASQSLRRCDSEAVARRCRAAEMRVPADLPINRADPPL